MSTEMKRFMLCITPEIEEGANNLKRNKFYDKPYSEVFRYLLSLGLKATDSDFNQSQQPLKVQATRTT